MCVQFQLSFRQFSLGREFELFIQCGLIGYFIVTKMPDSKMINIIFITNAVNNFLILFQETGRTFLTSEITETI